MRDLKLAKGIASDVETTYDSVQHESEAYYAYPLTLDYVVDVAFQNGTDGTMISYPVIVDTGSSNLAVAVASCSNCDTGSTDLVPGWYSDSEGDELCIDVTYGSGSWNGMMTDKINVGFIDGDYEELMDGVYVAGITSSDGFFCGGFYGILGLAYTGLTESYSTCSSSSGSGGGTTPTGGGQPSGGGSPSGGGRGRGGNYGPSSHASPYSYPSPYNQPRQSHAVARPQTVTRETRSAQQKTAAVQSPMPHASAAAPTQSRHATTRQTYEMRDSIPVAPKHPRELAATELEEAGTTMSSTPLLDSFYDDGLVQDNVFSILFCGDLASMAIGGVDLTEISDDDTQGLTYVTTQKTYDEIYGYFLVRVDSVSVAGEVVSTDSTDLNEIGGVLVDSGTTLIYLPTAVTSAIEVKVQAAVSSLQASFFQWSSCVEEEDLSSFPDLTLSLDGYDLILSPYQYLLWYSDCYYWGISSSSIPIIGNVALQGKLVVFDKEANQLGFADGDCSSYGGTSFDSSDGSSSSMQDASVTPQDMAARQTQMGTSASILAAAQQTVKQSTGAFVAGGVMVVLGVALAVVRTRASRKYAAVPSDEDDMDMGDMSI